MQFLGAVFLVLLSFSFSAEATPANPKNGSEFFTLPSPRPVQADGKKVEVIEFFMYHCPACNAVEPEVTAWVKAHKDTVSFRRIHVPHTGPNDPEAHLFLALEAMGNEDELHERVMRTWHVDRKRLKSDEDNIEWAVKNGLNRDKFLGYYNSFSVTTKLKSLPRVIESYRVDGTPTFIVDGRFLTTPTIVDASNSGIPQQQLGEATLQVVDALVNRAMSKTTAN